MAEPLTVDKFGGEKRRPQADKIDAGAHFIFEGVNLDEAVIRANRGRLKQNLKAITDLGKNGAFYYENSSGQREIIVCNAATINSLYINPALKGFFSFSVAEQLPSGRALAVDSSENIYLLKNATSTILKYDKSGTAQTSITIPDSAIGTAIVVDDDGIIYVAATIGGAIKIYKLNAAGSHLASISVTTTRNYLALKQGRLYIPKGVDLEVYNTDTLALDSTIAGTASETLGDLDFAPDGYIYAIWNDGVNRGIKKIGTSMTKIVNITTPDISNSASLTVDEFGRIWTGYSPSAGSRSIRAYDTDGTLLEELGENATDNTNFFDTSTLYLDSFTNELIAYDYQAANFKGIKVFAFRKWL